MKEIIVINGQPKTQEIKTCEYNRTKHTWDLRSDRFAFLDNYRHPRFPDDVQALLYREENGIEQVWVRLTFATKDNELFGELLNEPCRDYGCHAGDLIEIEETDTGDEKVLVSTGRIARVE